MSNIRSGERQKWVASKIFCSKTARMHKTKQKESIIYVVDCSMHDLLVGDAEGCDLVQQDRLILPYFRIPQLSSGGGPEKLAGGCAAAGFRSTFSTWRQTDHRGLTWRVPRIELPEPRPPSWRSVEWVPQSDKDDGQQPFRQAERGSARSRRRKKIMIGKYWWSGWSSRLNLRIAHGQERIRGGQKK